MDDLRRIPGFSNYGISCDGRVIMNMKRGKALRPQRRDGYLFVALVSDEGERLRKGVHNYVARAWIGPSPTPKHEVAHDDGSRDNNHFENLRWDTRKGNHEDVKRHGRSLHGERNGRAKLSDELAERIRSEIRLKPGRVRLPRGVASKIAKELGCCRETVLLVARGKSWNNGRIEHA